MNNGTRNEVLLELKFFKEVMQRAMLKMVQAELTYTALVAINDDPKLTPIQALVNACEAWDVKYQDLVDTPTA